MNIFACFFYFRAARLEREKRENKCSVKISTFTVIYIPAKWKMLCYMVYHIVKNLNNMWIPFQRCDLFLNSARLYHMLKYKNAELQNKSSIFHNFIKLANLVNYWSGHLWHSENTKVYSENTKVYIIEASNNIMCLNFVQTG